MRDPVALQDLEIQPGCYVFRMKPLQVSGFRMRAKKAGFETQVEKTPKARTIVLVWRPEETPPVVTDGPLFEVTADGWVLAQ